MAKKNIRLKNAIYEATDRVTAVKKNDEEEKRKKEAAKAGMEARLAAVEKAKRQAQERGTAARQAKAQSNAIKATTAGLDERRVQKSQITDALLQIREWGSGKGDKRQSQADLITASSAYENAQKWAQQAEAAGDHDTARYMREASYYLAKWGSNAGKEYGKLTGQYGSFENAMDYMSGDRSGYREYLNRDKSYDEISRHIADLEKTISNTSDLKRRGEYQEELDWYRDYARNNYTEAARSELDMLQRRQDMLGNALAKYDINASPLTGTPVTGTQHAETLRRFDEDIAAAEEQGLEKWYIDALKRAREEFASDPEPVSYEQNWQDMERYDTVREQYNETGGRLDAAREALDRAQASEWERNNRIKYAALAEEMNAAGWYFDDRDYQDFQEQVLSEKNAVAATMPDIYSVDVRDQYTQDEASVYSYLRAKGRQNEADEYANYMQSTAAARRNRQIEGMLSDEDISLMGRTLGAVATNPGKIVNTIDINLQKLGNVLSGEYAPIDYETTRNFGVASNANLESAAEKLNALGTLGDLIGHDIPYIGSYTLGDLYGAGVDILNSAFNSLLFGTSGAGAAMGAEKFSDEFAAAKERGGTDRQAYNYAGWSALAESLGEQIVLDRYLGFLTKLGTKPTRMSAVIAGLINVAEGGIQEAATTKMEQIVDRWTMGSNSEYERTVRLYMSMGYERTVAEKMALDDMNREILKSGIMGAIGQGAPVAIGSAVQSVRNAAWTAAEDAMAGDAINKLGNAQTMAQLMSEVTGQEVTAETGRRKLGKQQREFMENAGGYLASADETVRDITYGKIADVAQASEKPLDGTSQAAREKATKRAASMQMSETGASVGGESVTVQGFVRTAGKSGDARLNIKKADGTLGEADIGDITFDRKNAEAYSYAADMATPEVANAFRMSIEPAQAASIEQVANGYSQAYDMAKAGFREASVRASTLTGALTDAQLSTAYRLGAEARKSEQINAITAAKQRAEANLGSKWKGGTATFDESVVVDALDDEQKSQIDMASAVTGAMGVNVVFFESKADGTGRYTRENGSYNRRTNTIYIDVNAGRYYKGDSPSQTAMLRTLSHEVTHAIQRNSPETYAQLRDMVVDILGDTKGATIEDLIDRKMAQDGSLTARDAAIDELVADACEKMLEDSDAAQRLMEAHPEAAKTFFQKVGELLNKIAEAIRAAFKGRKLSIEAQLVMKDVERYQKMAELWTKGVMETAEVSGREIAINDEQQKLIDNDQPVDGMTEIVNSLRHDEDFMEAAEKKNATFGYVTPAVLRQAKKDRTTIRDFFRDPKNEELLKLPPDVMGNTFFADSSYGGSEESTSVCIRSMAAQDLMDAISKDLGRPLTVQDTLLISQEIAALTDRPECYYCYVATDRRAYREYLGNYLKQRDEVLDKYRAGSDREALYQEFLAGRKDTRPMKARFGMWLKAADSGTEMITGKDLASLSELFAEIEELKGMPGSKAKTSRYNQLLDATKYAQSASWAKKMKGYAAYNNHILKWTQKRVDDLNKGYGLRMYSFSDYSPAFVLENMQMLTDAAVRGLNVLAYTKEADFAEIFAPTGANMNVSVFAYEQNGQIAEDGMMGAAWSKARELRDKYPNVGIVVVATNDNIMQWAMQQDWVDVVIPYHLVRTGQAVADYFGYKNYTAVSGDKKTLEYKKGAPTSVSPVEHRNDIIAYVDALQRYGLSPRFADWMQGYDQYLAGELTPNQFREMNPYYMKLVNETRRSYADTLPVQPVFDMDAAKASIDTMIKQGGYYQPIGGSFGAQGEIAGEIAEKIRDSSKGNMEDMQNQTREYGDIDGREDMSKYSRYGIDWRRAYDRWANGRTPMSRAGYAMFSKAATSERVYSRGSRTGDTLYIYYGNGGTEIESILDKIRQQMAEDYENLALPAEVERLVDEYGIDDVVATFAPEDIVDSAGAFDNEDLTSWLYERVLEPNGIGAVLTPDGAIVFDESLIEKHGGVSQAEADDDVIEYSERLREEEGIQYQTREEAISTRYALANMLETDAVSGEEVAWLRGYKNHLAKLEQLLGAIDQNKKIIRELMFKKGRTEAESIELQKARERNKILQDKVASIDEGLLKLEKADVIRNLVAREEQKIRDREAEKRREGIAKVRESQRNTAIRKNIQRRAKRLDRMLRQPSDMEHIPEGLKGAMLELMEIFTGGEAAFGGAKADRERLYRAQREYEAMREDEDNADLASRFDEDTANRLRELGDLMKDRKIVDFNNAELTQLSMVIEHFEHLVRDQNEAFADSRRKKTEGYADQIWQQTMTMKGRKENAITGSALVKALKHLGHANVIPPYFYKHLGGAMGKLGNDLLKAEGRYGVNMNKAAKRLDEIRREYEHDKWATRRGDILKMETEIGDTLELTREQALGIWASAKRERLNTVQRAAHLRDGGVILEKSARKLGMKGQEINITPTKISQRDIQQIDNWLTDQQKKYADAMVDYISRDMAALGNETSMELAGYKKFGEGYYYPYKTSSDFRRTELGKVENALIKNMGFTKSVVRNAKTPVVITDFSATVAEHVNAMIMYNAFAVAQDQLMRVYDFKLDDSNSVKNLLRNAYGDEVPAYIEQHMRDLYGGVSPDRDAGLINRTISAHKKQAVLGSLSVVVQQPTALIRAMSQISPKYFAGQKAKGGFKEAMDYAGTAVIKDIGGFDSGVGRGATDWLNGKPKDWQNHKIRSGLDTVSDWAGLGAEYADKLAWSAIWKAVKREQADKYNVDIDSQELKELAGERFDEVVRLTQVYDSVMTRSQLMRNKNLFWKMATSFMSEPTVTWNMLYDAGIEAFKNKKMGKAGGIIASVLVSTILTNLAKAVVTAARDDDNEEATYLERYVKNAAEGLTNDAVIFNYMPIVRDIYSKLQGYDVERADMGIINDMLAAGEVMLDDEKAPAAKVNSLISLVSIMTGLPGKNIWRDVEAAFNTFDAAPQSEARPGWLENALRTGVIDATPIGKWFDLTDSKANNADRMYEAILEGDTAGAEELREHLKLYNGAADDKAVDSLLRTRIKEGYIAGEIDEDEALDMLTEHGGKRRNEAEELISEWSYTKDNEGRKYSDMKEAFLEGEISVEEAIDARVKYGGSEEESAEKTVQTWQYQKDTGYVYDDMRDDVLDGEISAKDAIAYRVKYGGVDRKTAEATVGKWEYERKYGYAYEDLRDEHAAGNVSSTEAMRAMTEYGGKDANDAYWEVAEWDYINAGGEWDGKGTLLDDAFAAGSASQVRSRMQELVGHSEWKKPGNELASYVTNYYKPIFETAGTERKRQLQPVILNYIQMAYETAGEEYFGDDYTLRYRSWLKIN